MLSKFISLSSLSLLILVSIVRPSEGIVTPQDKCSTRGGDLIVTDEDVSYKNAPKACAAVGGKLAALTNVNFNSVTSLLIQCKGPGTRGWIKSWQGTDYGAECLALAVGNAAPGGGVDVTCPEGGLPAICFVKPGSDEDEGIEDVEDTSASSLEEDTDEEEPSQPLPVHHPRTPTTVTSVPTDAPSQIIYPSSVMVLHPRKKNL